VVVRGPQRGDIALAGLPFVDEPSAAPAERRLPQLSEQEVGRQPRMPPVAVRETVNLDEAVMKARRDFVGWT